MVDSVFGSSGKIIPENRGGGKDQQDQATKRVHVGKDQKARTFEFQPGRTARKDSAGVGVLRFPCIATEDILESSRSTTTRLPAPPCQLISNRACTPLANTSCGVNILA